MPKAVLRAYSSVVYFSVIKQRYKTTGADQQGEPKWETALATKSNGLS